RLPLFAFGGAGPVHAYRIARSLGMSALLLPFGAGVMSTLGFLSAPLAFDFVRSWREQLQEMNWDKANALLDDMEAEGRTLLEASGVPSEAITHRREAEMRYVGQGHEIRVPLPQGALGPEHAAALQAAFEAVYRDLYERLGPAVSVEALN